MKSLFSMILSGVLLFSANDLYAFNPSSGDAKLGQFAVETCRACHNQLNKTKLIPSEKTREEWEKFFDSDYKLLRQLNHNFADIGISDRQLEHIHRYLVDAAKSEPQKSEKNLENRQKKVARLNEAATFNKKAEVMEENSMNFSASSPKTDRIDKNADSKLEDEGDEIVGKSDNVDTFDPERGDYTRGRYVLRKCLVCHEKKKVPLLNPGDRLKDQWTRLFSRDYRKLKKAMPDFDSYGFSVSQMEHLHQFMRKYAMDSDKPMTCN